MRMLPLPPMPPRELISGMRSSSVQRLPSDRDAGAGERVSMPRSNAVSDVFVHAIEHERRWQEQANTIQRNVCQAAAA